MAIYREIHTTFFSKSAADIIEAALKVVGVGKFYSGTSCRRTAANAIIQCHPNGEFLVAFDDSCISDWRLVSYVRGNNDINARKWLAWQIKDVVHHELSQNGDSKHANWKRDNDKVSKWLTDAAKHEITIKEAYCIYDLLMDRKNTDKRYDASLIEGFRGTENDPFKTEMEVQRRNEIEKINKEYDHKIDMVSINRWSSELYKKMNEELEAVRKRFSDESKRLTTELSAERDAKLKELDEQFSALAMI